jgi:hypothetical protein
VKCWSRSRAENRDQLGTSWPENKEILKLYCRIVKNYARLLVGALQVKAETSQAIKQIITVLDFNSLNKTGIQESTLIKK